MKHLIKTLTCCFYLLAIAAIVWISPASAQAIQQPFPTVQMSGAVAPDFNQIGFADFPPIAESGGFSEGGVSRSWQEGERLDQIITMGDISELRPQELTVEGINKIVGQDLSKVGLSGFSLVAKQDINSLLEAVPTLGIMPVSELPPISTLFGERAGDLVNERLLKGNSTLIDLVKHIPALGNLELDAIDLANFAVNSLPGLAQTMLGDFPGWEAATLSEVPGLGQLPLASFPNPLGLLGNTIMRIDGMWGLEESERQRTISGSDVMGFQVPCYVDREDCTSIELDDLENQGMKARSALEGLHWISGKYQEVKGGKGAWALINGGKEPTGRLPYGDVFKVVIWEPDEKTDTVTTAMFLRACDGFLGCTPYFIGPIPFLTHKRDSKIFVGALDTGSKSNDPSTPTGATKGGGMPRFEGGGDLPFDVNCLLNGTTIMTGTTVNSVGPSMSAAGVDLKKLSNAIAEIESLGSGGYSAVGEYVCADGGSNCGRGLGRYQFMNYNEFASTLIAKRPGGQVFLDRVSGGYRPTAEDLMKYFPPEDQDRAFQSSLANNIRKAQTEIDPTTGKPFTGDRIIERAAQMHFGGLYSTPDSGGSDIHGRLNLRDYGKRTLASYKRGGGAAYIGGNVCSPYGAKANGSFSAAPPSGPINQRIVESARQLFGMDTSSGPEGGREACAWAVNKVLQRAGLAPIGDNPNYVPSVVADMKSGRGQRVAPGQAKAGDIVMAKGYEHIGVCMNDGCTEVLSNSSSRASFAWKSDQTFGGYYNGSEYLSEAPVEEIYRVVQ